MAPLRPGHYTIKLKDQHGFECLRCGLKGAIKSFKTECPRANDTPKYPDEATVSTEEPVAKASANNVCESDSHEADLHDAELKHLQLLEQEFALLEAIQQEQEALEALNTELTMLQVNNLEGGCVDPTPHMVECLADFGYSYEVATWAVNEANCDWDMALELAFNRYKKEEHEAILTAEYEEELKMEMEWDKNFENDENDKNFETHAENDKNFETHAENLDDQIQKDLEQEMDKIEKELEKSTTSKARMPATPCASHVLPPAALSAQWPCS